ncbi:MAG: hypothetical protein KC621_13090 [Myxococcales bacterium]|nr:hypothetical protein [Myxococcales bacterium]
MRAWPLVFVVGCAVDSEDLAFDPALDAELAVLESAERGVAPPVQALTLTATVPHPGGDVILVAAGAQPGETVGFLSSLGGVAQGPCPAQLGGLCLDLGADTLLSGTVVADGQGRAALEVAVPGNLQAGLTVTFQAAIRRGAQGSSSVKSNPSVKTVGAPAWSHRVAIDGSLQEWGTDELFATTSGGNTAGGVTWDADTVYFAFFHPDVASGGPEHWEVIYIGTTDPGSTTGVILNTQLPGLPFAASLALRRKADGSYDDIQEWNGQTWVGTPNLLGTLGSSAAESGQGLEIAIPRGLIGSSRIQVVMAQVFEGNGFESTYGGVPDDSFVDGYDPNYATSLTLDLSSPDPSAIQNP